MVAFKVVDTREIVILSIFIASACAFNLDVVATEVKNMNNLMNTKKYARSAPVILNMQPNFQKTPKFLTKLMCIKQAETKLNFKQTRSGRKPRSIVIPQLPMVPFLVPLLPRIFPVLPKSLVPSLKRRFESMKNKKKLDAKLDMFKKKTLTPKEKTRVYEKLKEMRSKGALSYAEFHRFKRILL